MEYSDDGTKIDMYRRPVFRRTPRMRPRKNASSIIGTATEAAATFVTPVQLIAARVENIGVARRTAPQQSRGMSDKINPADKSRGQREFGATCKSVRLRTSSDRTSGQSKMTAATISARWK